MCEHKIVDHCRLTTEPQISSANTVWPYYSEFLHRLGLMLQCISLKKKKKKDTTKFLNA